MKHFALLLSIGIGVGVSGMGCQRADTTPRVPVPAPQNPDTVRTSAPMRPMPPDAGQVDPRPFADEPILRQQLPGEGRFVEAYRQVGSPRMVLFVNRTLEGQLLPVNPPDPQVRIEQSRRTDGPVVVESRGVRQDGREVTDRLEAQGPVEYRESTEVYLQPGQYDEAWAHSLDYQAIENIMTDWLAAGGNTRLISPTMARGRLTEQQIADLQSGRPKVMSEVARQLDADILIQVQARPTRQTRYGLEVRLVCEAISLRGGESIGRAVVDMPPPLEKTTINRYTRFLASKLMDDMAQTWLAAGPAPAPDSADRPDAPSAPQTPQSRDAQESQPPPPPQPVEP